jgi:hypothetical protein
MKTATAFSGRHSDVSVGLLKRSGCEEESVYHVGEGFAIDCKAADLITSL